MASKKQLADEIRSKDQKIQSLDQVNKALNKRLNEVLIAKKNLEGVLISYREKLDECKKKRWFEVWK